LQRNSENRLGYHSSHEVLNHVFFKNIDFNDVYNEDGPFVYDDESSNIKIFNNDFDGDSKYSDTTSNNYKNTINNNYNKKSGDQTNNNNKNNNNINNNNNNNNHNNNNKSNNNNGDEDNVKVVMEDFLQDFNIINNSGEMEDEFYDFSFMKFY
jgi:hypothetical protein